MIHSVKRTGLRSHCAVNFAVQCVGDSWSLLIVRDIAFNGKHTYKEFLAADERISTNILADRLQHLQTIGVIEKHPDPGDARGSRYALTEKGVGLIPALLFLSEWSFTYDPETEASPEFARFFDADPIGVTRLVQQAAREGRAAFAGNDSVLRQLLADKAETRA